MALRDCAYEGATILVHLKGQEKAARRESTRNRATPSHEAAQEDNQTSSAMMTLLEDIELLKKD